MARKNRMAEGLSDKQLKREIKKGKRSTFFGAMTSLEMYELVDLINNNGGVATLNGTILSTNRPDLHDEFVGEYVIRKMSV